MYYKGGWDITELSSKQNPRKFSVPTSLGIIRLVMKMIKMMMMMMMIRVVMMMMMMMNVMMLMMMMMTMTMPE